MDLSEARRRGKVRGLLLAAAMYDAAASVNHFSYSLRANRVPGYERSKDSELMSLKEDMERNLQKAEEARAEAWRLALDDPR